MASVYTNDLRLEEIGSGEQSGTWGDTTNTNLELIAEAFSFGTEAITTNADTHTTTIADGATDPGRSIYLKYTGTLDSACTITLGPNTVSKVWFIENATSGSQNIIISQGSGANVTIGNGAVKMVYSDGAGSGAAVVDALVDLDLTGTTTIAAANISGDLDVDGTTNLDVVDIDGAVDMASTLQVDGAITSSSGATITTADNNPQLTLISTDTDANVGPVLDLNRNVTGADDDNLGSITFTAKDDAGNAQTYAKIDTSIRDASNSSEASRLNFHVANNGSVTKFLGFIGQTASAGAEITFNEDSNDIDFRVESNGNANMINVDAGNDRVGIGMIPDTTALTVSGQIGTTNGSASAPTHSFYSDADTGMFRTAANIIGFATGGTERVQIGSFGVAADQLTNKTASGGITIDAAGDITLDADGGNIRLSDGGTQFGKLHRDGGDFKISSSENNKDIIFMGADGGADIEAMRIDMSEGGNVGIGTSSPSFPLSVQANSDAEALLVLGRSADDIGEIAFRENDNSTKLGELQYRQGYGILRHRVGYLSFETGGATERMRIDSSGNVLIGNGVSHVDVNTGPDLVIGSSGNAGTDGSAIAFVHNGGDLNAYIGGQKQFLTIGTYTATDVRLITSNTERVRIASGGVPTFTQTSTNTDPESDLGCFAHFRNTSATTNTGFTITLGSNDNPGTGIYARRIGSNNEHELGFQVRNSSGSSVTRAMLHATAQFTVNTKLKTYNSSSAHIISVNTGSMSAINVGTDSTSSRTGIVFTNTNGTVGSITMSGTSTAYNTSSDYRLKENIVTDWDATSRLKQLKPSRFNFKDNKDLTVDGFLAHEVSDIVPEAVTGTKDETEKISNVVLNADGTVLTHSVSKEKWEADKIPTTDLDGNEEKPVYSSDTTWVESKTIPKYQGIDQSKLVPLLVKTIQELEARIAKLEGA